MLFKPLLVSPKFILCFQGYIFLSPTRGFILYVPQSTKDPRGKKDNIFQCFLFYPDIFYPIATLFPPCDLPPPISHG